jgi:hypothetical protein
MIEKVQATENVQSFPRVVLAGIADPDRAEHVDAGQLALRLQVLEVIRGVLHDSRPESDQIRARMRYQLALHPGFPELALLAHLKEAYAAEAA